MNKLFKSLRSEILLAALVPLLVLTVVVTLCSRKYMQQGIQDTTVNGLRDLCVSVQACYDGLNDGDFYLSDDGYLMKGDVNLSQDETVLDPFVKGSKSAVTLFFGDTRYATTLISKDTGKRIVGTTASQAVCDIVLKGGEYSATNLTINGQNYYAYYLPMTNSDGSVVGMFFAGTPSTEIDSFINQKIMTVVIVAVVMLVVAFLIVFLVSAAIAKAVGEAKNCVDALAKGDLTNEIPEKMLERADEIGSMSRSVNDCTEKLRAIMVDIQDAATKVKNSGSELQSMSNSTSKNADEISSAVEDISKGAVSMAEDIENATKRVAVMGERIEDIVSNIGTLNDLSNDMKKAGDQAGEIMKTLAASNEKTSEGINMVAQNVRNTDASVSKISEAVNLIMEIAGQTNLLSLNASIEAARAGEAGKGFAVVAGAIKNLSEESNDSAGKITAILEELTADSKASMQTMDEVSHMLEEQQKKMEEAISVFNNVSDGIASSKDSASSINGQANDCDSARSDVVDVIQNLSAISEENAASTQETTASMEELNATINLLSESANELADLAVNLEDEIQFFKL